MQGIQIMKGIRLTEKINVFIGANYKETQVSEVAGEKFYG